MIPSASNDLHGYNAWRRSLVPSDVGAVFRMKETYDGVTRACDMKAGSYWKIQGIGAPMFGKIKYDADKVYVLVACTATGKLYKRREYVSVECIARWIDEGIIENIS